MGVLATIIAQVLDPVRIALIAAVMIAARLAMPVMRWPVLILGLAIVALIVPQLLSGVIGDQVIDAAILGFVANAIIAGILFGVWKLFRYWF